MSIRMSAASSGVRCFLLASLFFALPGSGITVADADQSFVVKVEQGRLRQVEAAYRLRGYSIQQVNEQHSFLVVQSSPYPATVAAASVQTQSNSSRVPGWLKYGPQQQASDTGAGQVHESFLQNGLNAQASYKVARRQVSAAAVAATVQTITQLSSVDGVKNVQQNSYITLLNQPPKVAVREMSRALSQSTSSSAIFAYTPASCPAVVSTFPDANLGKETEGTPYGVHMVEADDEIMVQISKDHNNKVMWCVIDTGLDRNNPEFHPGATSGCLPGNVRGDGTRHDCEYAWFDDEDGHGTHTSGTIAALRNGKAVVGVSAEGANVYHYNIFGSDSGFAYTDLLRAWDDCLKELDWRKLSTNTPEMKMVVSMSVGGPGNVQVVSEALASIASSRPDVLFVAAAGNEGDSELNYPAADLNVVSVAAVDWLRAKADFSTYNKDVEWAAPGVLTLSTVPMWAASSTRLSSTLETNPFVPPVNAPDILTNPEFLMIDGSATGVASGPLVDCGLGNSPCSNASGKICLLQRGGGVLFCVKVANCLAGGGVGAVIYGRDDDPNCQQLTGLTLQAESCIRPAQGWPVVLTATKGQGYWLRDQPAEVVVTLKAVSDTGGQALNFLSGTSMATPTAAGVAGLVWSYHSNCTAQALKAAISASAKDAGVLGRDDSFGYGIVNAVAAHNYLLQNPCPPPAPSPSPAPVDCSGYWEWSECDKPCGGGQQTATYIVSKIQLNGGTACPFAAGTTQSRPCNAQACLQAVDDSASVKSGRWTAIPVLANDLGDQVQLVSSSRPVNGGILKLARASSTIAGTKLTAVNSSNIVYYLSKPGYTGVDSFTYRLVDTQGGDTTATVTVQVSVGSCRGSSCTSGSCDTATGRCICKAPQMVPMFIKNPEAASRSVTPRIPACRYQYMPIDPLGSSRGLKAKFGSTIPVAFRLGPSSRCLRGQVVQDSWFTRSDECPAAADMTPLGGVASAVGLQGCVSGQYVYVVKVTQPVGCYRLVLQFADGGSRSTLLRVI